ncbi:MAG: hypothetical protein A2Y69_09550 [Candidatus Aminicenantes bacterium RBG_13_59_9]|nr:MAG: hypothetical protein A2Y69_09550 [Candidatus Aminicenantes bacterium RBG_13_59_9]
MTKGAFSSYEVLPVRSSRDRKDDGFMYFHCCGPSMSPTLKPGDLIVVAPYASRPVRRGDLIVFRLQDCSRLIVHRVAAVREPYVMVRGDNNTRPDPWLPEMKDILGRVVQRQRSRNAHFLAGGAAGDLYGRAARALAEARRTCFRLFRPAYLWAAEQGIIRRLLPFRLRTRMVAVERPEGTEFLLLAGRIVIARRPANSGTWLVRRPFKLLVDVRSLSRGLSAPPGDADGEPERPAERSSGRAPENDIMTT